MFHFTDLEGRVSHKSTCDHLIWAPRLGIIHVDMFLDRSKGDISNFYRRKITYVKFTEKSKLFTIESSGQWRPYIDTELGTSGALRLKPLRNVSIRFTTLSVDVDLHVFLDLQKVKWNDAASGSESRTDPMCWRPYQVAQIDRRSMGDHDQ